jgi:hypothetical protein
VTFTRGTSNSDRTITTDAALLEVKMKKEDSEDIPRSFLRGGGEMPWSGAATGANAIGVKRSKFEVL